MDAKLLATIIAVAKKEASTVSVDTSRLAATIEAKLKEFHKKSPILETPEFSIVNGSLQCSWHSGLKLNLGSVVGPKGDSIKGDKGDSVKGDKGDKGEPGPSVKGNKGDPGESVKGDKGEPGVSVKGPAGLPGKSVKGDKGPPGDSVKGDKGEPGRDARGIKGDEGDPGLDGLDGVGVDKIHISENHHLMFKMTSGKTIDAGYARGAAGVNASKGGRVSGAPSMGSGFRTVTPRGIAILDFGSGALEAEVLVTNLPLMAVDSVVMCAMRIEETPEHPVDDLLVDPIRVAIKDFVTASGFTIYGTMDNGRANGTYKVHWHLVE